MPSKYDTNPLDPEFPERAKAAAPSSAATPSATQYFEPSFAGETQQFDASLPTEEQTRRFEADEFGHFQQYQQPFDGHSFPLHHPRTLIGVNDDPHRKVAKIGLAENIVTAIPYIPWYLGLIGGVVLLAIMPRSETKVRFHAAQGLAAHVCILLVTIILGAIGNATDVAEIANGIFQLVTTIMLVVFAIKAWKGKPVHIGAVDDLTNWLDEKISPKSVGTE